MTVVFTDEEMRWINKTPFHWSVKEGCPSKLKKTLKKKLAYLYDIKQ